MVSSKILMEIFYLSIGFGVLIILILNMDSFTFFTDWSTNSKLILKSIILIAYCTAVLITLKGVVDEY